MSRITLEMKPERFFSMIETIEKHLSTVIKLGIHRDFKSAMIGDISRIKKVLMDSRKTRHEVVRTVRAEPLAK